MCDQLEESALDYSKTLLRFDYSTYDGDNTHQAERLEEGADQRAIDDLLGLKEQRFVSLLREESDAEHLKQIALKNAGNLEYEKVLIPLLERYAELCEPNLLLYLLLSSLYWTHGEDEVANRYLDMAAELDSDSVFVLRHRLLYTSDPDTLSRICAQILEAHPGDAVAIETMTRMDKGITPYQSPRTGEHASVDLVLENLSCGKMT